jgi:hypothetical protein
VSVREHRDGRDVDENAAQDERREYDPGSSHALGSSIEADKAAERQQNAGAAPTAYNRTHAT